MSWLLLASLALGQDTLQCVGLDPASEPLCRKAYDHERVGDWKKASNAWFLVRAADPDSVEASMGLGRSYERMGRRRDAENIYRSMPYESDAVEALARLIEADDPERAVKLYKKLRTLRLGDPDPILWQAQASLEAADVNGSVEAFNEWLEFEGAELEPAPTGEHMVALAGALKEADRREEAIYWLDLYLETFPDGELGDEVRSRKERMAVEDAADNLQVGGAEDLGPDQRIVLDQARQQVAAGRLEAARELLDGLLLVAARSPDAWSVAGDVALQQGRVSEAEQAYLTAVALEPDEPTWKVQLGRLLADRYGGRRHREAVDELEQALTMRPSWTELHLDLARVYRELGEFEDALEHCNVVLDQELQGELHDRAQVCVQDLARERPDPPQVDQLFSKPPDGISEDAWSHFKLAQVYLEDRDDDAAARTEVELALALEPLYVDALNLLARLQLRDQDLAGAIETYLRSLDERPGQAQIVLAVGYSLQDQGRQDEAAQYFREAAELDMAEAWYALAVLEVDAGRWQEARPMLDAYFTRASSGRYHDDAVALRDELTQRWRLQVGGAAGGAGFVVLAPLLWLLRRRGGWSLERFLGQTPEAFREVANILSAMRHEVIKHNTTVLPTAADALEAGTDEPVIEAIEHLASVIDRWEQYVVELESLAKAHGVRLNLRVKDPVFAPMIAAFDELKRIGRRIGPGGVRGDRVALAGRMRRVSEALNEQGYVDLGRLIRDVCVLHINGPVLQECWDQVCAEPAFADRSLPAFELVVDTDALPVRIFRRELQDIVVNLLRNGLAVALEEQGDQARIGLHLEEEVDFVTGLESVVLRFQDNALSTLTDDMIRGRYIARGLGLVVDLVGRNDGALKVEAAHQPWSKALVVRLPRAEVSEQ